MTLESCRKFVEVLASDAPAPGGGDVDASIGLSLALGVNNRSVELTINYTPG